MDKFLTPSTRRRNFSQVEQSPEDTMEEGDQGSHLEGNTNIDNKSDAQEKDLLQIVLISLDSLHNKFDNKIDKLESDIHNPETGIIDRLAIVAA